MRATIQAEVEKHNNQGACGMGGGGRYSCVFLLREGQGRAAGDGRGRAAPGGMALRFACFRGESRCLDRQVHTNVDGCALVSFREVDFVVGCTTRVDRPI